jgi:hypothetical protein
VSTVRNSADHECTCTPNPPLVVVVLLSMLRLIIIYTQYRLSDVWLMLILSTAVDWDDKITVGATLEDYCWR